MSESLLKDLLLSESRRGNGNSPEMGSRLKPEAQDEVLAAVRQLRINLTRALADITDRDRALTEARQKLKDSEELRIAAADAQRRTAEALAQAQKEAARREQSHAESIHQLFDRIAELEVIRTKYMDMQSRYTADLQGLRQHASIVDAGRQVTKRADPVDKEGADASAPKALLFAKGYPYFEPDDFRLSHREKDFVAVGRSVHRSPRSGVTRVVHLPRSSRAHRAASGTGIKGRRFGFRVVVEGALIALLAGAAIALYPDNRPAVSSRLRQTMDSIIGILPSEADRAPTGFRSTEPAIDAEGKTSFLNRQSNVRRAASGTAPVLMTLPRGTPVQTFETSGSWTRVRVGHPSGASDADGWIFALFLSNTPDL